MLKFTKQNLQAIESGRKTQTRRPVKPQPSREATTVELVGTHLLGAIFCNIAGNPRGCVCGCGYGVGFGVPLADIDGMPVDTRVQITGIRVERLQSISEADAIAEGCERHPDSRGTWKNYIGPKPRVWLSGVEPWKRSFESLWGTIYGPEHQFSWAANPWCWVYDFEVLR